MKSSFAKYLDNKVTNEKSIKSPITKCIKCSSPPLLEELIMKHILPNPYFCAKCILSSYDPWTKHISAIHKPFRLLHPSIPTRIQFDYTYKRNEDFIIIRCLQISSTGYFLKWPMKSVITINNKILLDYSQNETKNKGLVIFPIKKKLTSFKKKKNIFEFTEFFKQINQMTFTYSKNDYALYFVSIDSIKTNDSIYEIIRETKTLRDINNIKVLVGINNEVKIEKEKIDLIDVYTKVNSIKIPARGINCVHLNVFDLKIFLLFTKRSRKSSCPICNKLTGEIYIDGIISDKIKKTPNLIGLIADNDYNFIEEIIGEKYLEESKPAQNFIVETIIINDDDEDDAKTQTDAQTMKENCNNKTDEELLFNKDDTKDSESEEQLKLLSRKRDRDNNESQVEV